MAADSSQHQQILIVFLGVALIALVCKTFRSDNDASSEPYQNKITYKSSFSSANAFPSNTTPTSTSTDTTDIYKGNPQSASSSIGQFPEPYNLSQNDQNHFDFASMAGISKAADFSKQYKATKGSEYIDPATMLPQSDMSNNMIRDPVESGWVYDRPVFSLTKSTNRNESDPIRGDLQITSEKTGWFDSTLSRNNTLKRGYVGSTFMDNQQVLDLQDVIYQPQKSQEQRSYIDRVQQTYGSSAVQPDLRFGKSQENLAL